MFGLAAVVPQRPCLLRGALIALPPTKPGRCKTEPTVRAVASQTPCVCRAGNGPAKEFRSCARFRNRKALPRVCLGPSRIAMMFAQCFLNFVQCCHALFARLPVPEHDKALSADTTMGFSVALRALAEYLHADLESGRPRPAQKETIVRFHSAQHTPSRQLNPTFVAPVRALFGGEKESENGNGAEPPG